MLRLKNEIDIQPLQALYQGLSDAAFQNAWRRALRKTGNWVRVHVAKRLSTATRIPQKVIKQRVYFFLRSQMHGKVWLGLNPIEAGRLGSARQTRAGVTVGRHRFPGAWVMRYRDPGGVYRRTGRWMTVKRKVVVNGPKEKLLATVQGKLVRVVPKGPRAREYWVTQRREAYEKVKVEWDAAAESVFREVAEESRQRLLEILEQEIRWEIRKATQ
ncbi:phage tail protein [Chromobacterium haemolyticum]|uniref:Phage tail protein n=1 Tax=Chromobacterium fluminis TaxID=3044269 RepID=A0ABX0LLN2_9NEIS|nr:phage tail protein [Chromobacterium haemolyticum]NHR08072.1 phage tail protein [Chromobacterium haemolyticum]